MSQSEVTIEVGQVWAEGSRSITVESIKGILIRATDGNDYHGPTLLRFWTLSPAPSPAPAVNRAGCKAWCGYLCFEIHKKLGEAVYQEYLHCGRDFPGDDCERWCSWLCRDMRVPPLPSSAVKPGAVPYEPTDDAYVVHKPAQPEPAKGPVCGVVLQGDHKHGGNVLQRTWRGPLGIKTSLCCDSCREWQEAAINLKSGNLIWSGILRDPAVPDRLPRPRLVHSMGVEDACLPEVW